MSTFEELAVGTSLPGKIVASFTLVSMDGDACVLPDSVEVDPTIAELEDVEDEVAVEFAITG